MKTNYFARLFPLEEINGAGICPTYLYRWTVLSCRWGKIYVHHVVGDDWALDPHDHPHNFLIIGCWGSYWEETYDAQGNAAGISLWKAPWVRRFPATHAHRIESSYTGGAWTLCLVSQPVRPWGFWWRHAHSSPRCWVRWDRYITIAGQDRKAC